MKGLGKPKASACGVRMTAPQDSHELMSQLVLWPASRKSWSRSWTSVAAP